MALYAVNRHSDGRQSWIARPVVVFADADENQAAVCIRHCGKRLREIAGEGTLVVEANALSKILLEEGDQVAVGLVRAVADEHPCRPIDVPTRARSRT